MSNTKAIAAAVLATLSLTGVAMSSAVAQESPWLVRLLWSCSFHFLFDVVVSNAIKSIDLKHEKL